MDTNVAALVGFGLMLLVSVAAGSQVARQTPTLFSYFWANRTLKERTVVQLLLSTSFSLNGLLYHAWLGYTIGVYSIFIQAIWCAGYIFLALNAQRVWKIAGRDNLHGNLGATFTPPTAKVAALATIIGFASLAGWEFVIAGGLIQQVLGVQSGDIMWVALLIAVVVAAYTIRGGLRGNGRANTAQNITAFVALVVLAFYLFAGLPNATPQSGDEWLDSSKLLQNPLIALGGVGFFANAYFSLVWQTADATNWQSMSSSGGDARKLRSSLIWSSALIVIAPGIIGTAIGIALRSVAGVTSDNIVAQAILALDLHPLAIVLIAAGLCGAMLSTLDGLLLACANAFSWDLFKPKETRVILEKERAGQPLSLTESNDETRILMVSYISIFVLAAASALVVALLDANLPLFNIVYFAVIGQMAMVPCAVLMVLTDGGPVRRHGATSILFGLIGGFALLFYSLSAGDLGPVISTYIPLATSAFAVLPLLLPKSAAKSN